MILVDEDKVKVFQSKHDSLQVGNLNVGQRNDQEGRLDHLHQTLGGRLEEDVLFGKDTGEAQLSIGNLDIERFPTLTDNIIIIE